MRVRIFIVVGALLAFAAAGILPVHGQGCSTRNGYYVASFNGDIDPGAADFMSTTVGNAESMCSAHIVFILTTNGGNGGSMESMIGSIASFQHPNLTTFITVVAPQGSFAFSAGAYIAEASDKIYMEPATTIGSATPIVSGIPTGQENTTLRKDINAFASYMETLTGAHGRNATAARLMVTQGLSYPYDQAQRVHVIDQVINSTTVAGALSFLGVPADTQVNTPGFRPSLISVLSNPNVSSLLFLIGVFAVLADIYHPTLVLSIAGVVVIAIALFGLGVFGASPLSVFLMIVGAGFIFLEVKTQHGVSAMIGVVIFVVGFLLIFQLPPASASNPSLPPALFSGIPDITYGLLVALGAAIVIASLYLRSIREGLKGRPKVNEPSVLIGRSGTMLSDLQPGGKGVAQVASEEWSVTSDQQLKKGDPVRVKGVSGLALIVERQEQ